MNITRITLLFYVILAETAALNVTVASEYFEEQLQLLWNAEPEAETTCRISRSNDTHNLFLMCPTQVDCYLKSYSKDTVNWSVPPWPFDLNEECQAIYTKALPVSKAAQLNSLLRAIRLTNQSGCDEFSSIATLNMAACGLVNMGQLGRSNDNLDKCPSQLKYLNLAMNIIKSLPKNSFRQFKKLQYLEMYTCNLSHVEDEAFVDLVQLKQINLEDNQLSHLPVSLFKSNVHLQLINLMKNRLLSPALNALVSIPSLQHLFLQTNRINFIDERLAFPSSLIRLYAGGNHIQNIGLELTNLNHLMELAIYSNEVDRVDKNAFRNLTRVTFINLEKNALEELHEDTFKNTFKLVSLILQGNKLSVFPAVGHLANLKVLNISNNKISTINKNHLINCTQLFFLDLHNNQLSFIEEGSFRNIRRLETLDLAHNRLTEKNADFTSSNILALYLRFNNFTAFTYEIISPSVVSLEMSDNQIEIIEEYNFNNQRGKQCNLTGLDLSNNQIRSIEMLKLPLSIQSVNLKSNKIGQIFSLNDIKAQNLLELRSINVENNNISTLCQSSFRKFSLNLKVAYKISGNPIKCSCENVWLTNPRTYSNYVDFQDLNATFCQQVLPLKSFDEHRQITKLEAGQFVCQSEHLESKRCDCPPTFNMRCEAPCPTNCTCFSDYSFTRVHFLCGNRHLTRVSGGQKDFNIYDNAETFMDFSDNDIDHVGAADFKDLPKNIIHLNLNNSKIRSIDKNAFDELTNMTDLNLANNRLEAVPDELLSKQTQMTHLDLSNNRLTRLADDAFSHLVNLQVLSLHGNRLNALPLNQIAQLKWLSNISLHENPWSCECVVIESFREFLFTSSNKVDNKMPLNCTENGQLISIPNFNMERCFKQSYLTTLIVALVFATILMITVGLVFKWRYELQVLVYSRYGLRMLHWRRREEEVEDKQYDAFIAYNSNDEDFLVNELMPGLEAIENPYRLCIHLRDFPAGALIQDSILEAIRLSSRTIIILSENFVQSGWCRFEFKSAHMQMMQDRCPRVLLIVLDDVPETLDPEMKLYLKTNTYLKWGDKWFWQKLYYAMPDPRVTSPRTDIMPMREY